MQHFKESYDSHSIMRRLILYNLRVLCAVWASLVLTTWTKMCLLFLRGGLRNVRFRFLNLAMAELFKGLGLRGGCTGAVVYPYLLGTFYHRSTPPGRLDLVAQGQDGHKVC